MLKGLLSPTNPYLQKITRFYNKYQRFVPVLAFLGGFGWDSATLTRIDKLFDNFFLLGYILLLGGFIILVNLVEQGVVRKPLFVKYKEWYPLVIQFFLGGLFSAYVIFYSRSAAFTKTDLFLALLVILLVANEFLRERLSNIYFQMSLYFLVCFAFFTFFLPVITKTMSVWLFIAGGILSLGMIAGCLFILWKNSAIKSREHLRRVSVVVAALYVALNLFYWLNWIPPVPLSLKHGGIYHQAERAGDFYRLQFEKPKWYEFFKKSDDTFHQAPGDVVHCFASVFAPAQLNTQIYHHWQKYSPERDVWTSTDRLSYPITGGRDGGFRGYTRKQNISPGEWRVDVETSDGRLLGRIKFEVEAIAQRDYELKEIFM
jgi:hypothetical protein